MGRRLPVDEVRRRIDAGEPILFVDSREPDAWEQSSEKLPGAVRVLSDAVDEHAAQLAKGRPLVTYCTTAGEAASSKTARRLEELGFRDVAVLIGGLDAWIAAGGETEHKFTSALEEATAVPQ
jgi:rhodanese-related sulfurtransferase